MNREAYRLANEIRTDFLADGDRLMECPEDMEMEMRRYETTALNEIRNERKRTRRTFGKMTVAACAAVTLLTGTVLFGGEVHAAIEQITWSIGNALGLSGELENYRDVIHTSVADKGYVVTLQEAVVSEEKLTVNYTVQREDGEPMEQYLTPMEILTVNGEQPGGGAGGSASFLDEGQTVLGVEMSYHIPGVDLSGENEFRIKIRALGSEDEIKGNWDFAFTADGAALMADTKRIPIGKEFTLPDGVTVTLEELTMNELEQRISFTKSGATNYMPQILAGDSEGNQVEFGLRSSDETSGYLSNEEIIDDGRISDTADRVTMTFGVIELPEESGQITDEFEPVGEVFELELQ
ncbi:MAG: DUF4179 domain-containing protein [Lachnospiraceae bacterium]|nr:DUF4179 domain-containing protein [Lachnospiraceae bacterium]